MVFSLILLLAAAPADFALPEVLAASPTPAAADETLSRIAPNDGPGADAPGSGLEFHDQPMACTFPIRWTIADLDPRFGLSREEAADAIRQAGMLWEEAVSRPLLFQESSTGMRIRFVYDGRQEDAHQRAEMDAIMAARVEVIEEATASLEQLREELSRTRTAHEQRSLDYRERMDRHARNVEYWNSVGGAPAVEFQRLEEEGDRLDELRQRMNAEAEEINRLVDRVNEETDRINSEIAALNEERAEMGGGVPAASIQSARYEESRSLFGAVSRELDVYHFEDRNHLVRILAHELGHALGLEHSDVPGSLMDETRKYHPDDGRPRAHESDAAALRSRCPAL